MATDASTLYKLIILYMLDRVNSPMTNAQISEFVLEKGYTTYFTLQEVLNTLISDGFITEESYHSSTHYTITDSGRETINFFCGYLKNRCPDSALFRESMQYAPPNHCITCAAILP